MISGTMLLLLAAGFFIIAALYSSVGFGGGSSYLALMALVMPDFLQIKTTALLCNLVVVGSGSFLFMKRGYFNKRKFLPLALFSVPMAFLGATIHLTQQSFFIFLGGILALSGVLLILQFFLKPAGKALLASDSLIINVGLGGGTGFLSGLVGIGGGILLSPVLNLLKWDEAKRIAALASFFILVNSAAGLLGQLYSGSLKANGYHLLLLLTSVFLGGQIGTRLSLRLLDARTVRLLTGFLVSYIGIKLVVKYTFKIDI